MLEPNDLSIANQRFLACIQSENRIAESNINPFTIKETKSFANKFITTLLDTVYTNNTINPSVSIEEGKGSGCATAVSRVDMKTNIITKPTLGNKPSSYSNENWSNTSINAFLCLYYCSNKSELPYIIKNHQSFIINLFQLKLHQLALNHLKILFNIITSLVHHTPIKYKEYSKSQLLNGIEFTQTASLANLVVAFHFLFIQCLMQLISFNYTSITDNNEFINLQLLKQLPSWFDESSNFIRWLKYSTNPSNDEKHKNNIIKILKGFIKVCDGLSKKFSDLAIITDQFVLKLREWEESDRCSDQNEHIESTQEHKDHPVTEYNNHGPYTKKDIYTHLQLIGAQPQPHHISQFKILLSNCPSDLFNDPKFMTQTINCITKFSDSQFPNIILNYLIRNFKSFKAITKNHFQLFDLITNKLTTYRDLKIAEQLYFIFSKFKQQKRIRHLSNFCYNLGLKYQDFQWFKLSLDYEFSIYYNGQLDLLQTKLEKVLGNYFALGKVQESFGPLFKFFKILDMTQEHSTSILCKLLIPCLNRSTIEIVFGPKSELSPGFKTSLFKVITELNYAGVNSIIQVLDLEDEVLRLECIYNYYNMKLEDYLDFDFGPVISDPMISDSLKERGNSYTKNLLVGGIILNRIINIEWNLNNLKLSIEKVGKYLQSNTIHDYENPIISKLIQYLKFNKLHHLSIPLIEKYMNCRDLELNVKFDLYSDLIETHLDNSDYQKVETLLSSISSFVSEITEPKKLLNWKLIQLHYHINTNPELAMKTFNETLEFVKDKPEFDLNKTKYSLGEKLWNLILIVKFLLISSKLNLKLGNPVQEYHNIKMGIKLMASIIRTADKSMDYKLHWTSNSLAVSLYYSMLQVLKLTGVSSDLGFYISELEKVNDSIICPLINGVVFFYLADTLRLIGDIEKADEQLFKGGLIVEMGFNELENIQFNSELLRRSFGSESGVEKAREIELFTSSIQPYSSKEIDYLCNKFEKNVEKTADKWSQMTEIKNKINRKMKKLELSYNSLQDSVLISLNPPICIEDSSIKSEIFTLLNSQKVSVHEFKDLTFQLHNLETFNLFSDPQSLRQLYHIQDYGKHMSFKYETNMKQTEPSGLFPSELQPFDNQLTNIQTFYTELEHYLPSNWKVFTIDIDPKSETLYISKLSKTLTPEYVKLPLTRMQQFNTGSRPMDFKTVIKRLGNIIRKSNESIKPNFTARMVTQEDRKLWWKIRFSLDLQMCELLEDIELYWFGCFSYFFHDKRVISQKVNYLMADIFSVDTTTNSSLVELVTNLIGTIKDVDETNYDEVQNQNYVFDDLVYFIVDSLIYRGADISYEQVDTNKFRTGVLDIVKDYHQEEEEDHIILIPGSNCSGIPWECLDCFKQKSVSRMPSIHMMIDMLKARTRPQKPHDLHYLINPGGDLKTTEAIFKPKFLGNPKWTGFIGSKPNDNDKFLEDLLNKDLFVYIGHGGCDQYIKPSSLFMYTDSNTNLPPSLLIGCSSGALQSNGIFGRSGNIYNWLCCGSPMVVANLWDVTDKDIDKFSLSVFSKWGLFEGFDGEDISKCIKKSRGSCVLKFLNGSAPVVYGVPN